MRYLFLFIFTGVLLNSNSQDIDDFENNLDLQNRTDALENNNWNYSEYPKDINEITEEELEYLNILSHDQIESFLRYRRFVKKLYSIYEVLDIPNFDTHTFFKLAPYLKYSFKQKTETREYLIVQSNRILNTNDSPFSQFQRNQYQVRLKKEINPKVAIGLSLDSDIGESVNFNKQSGTNHAVGYVFIKKTLHLDKIIIGNFSNHYGQGLMFSNQFFNGKSSKSIYNSYSNSDETTAYKSMGENGYLQGISLYKKTKHIKFYTWASALNLHGTATNDTLNSIYTTGYFRNNKEYLKRNVSNETAIGGRMSFKFLHNNIKIGLSGANFHYSTPVLLYYMTEAKKDFLNLGIDYLIKTKYISLFGELVNQNGKNTQLHGFQSNIDDNTRFSIIYRNYDSDYFTLRGNGFSSYSNNRNEEGLYLSTNHKLNEIVEFFGYLDRYKHNIPSYGEQLATKNTSWILGTNFLLNNKQRVLIAFKQDIFGQEVTNNKIPQEIDETFKHIFITHKVESNQLFITSNIQLKSNQNSESINIGQYFTQKSNKLQYTLGYNIFNASNYDLRLYQYQPDLTFNNSFNLLSGKGSQFYGTIKIKITKRFILSSKIIWTTFSDKDEIVKGLETIYSNNVWEGKLQMFYKL